MNEMKRSGTQFGLATLCIGGGQGGAMILENAN
jgi:acetyl-CoA acyltransferase